MAYFIGADLAGASFNGSDLTGATFNHANLTNANLSGSNLTGADFAGAHVQGAHFDRYSFEYDGTGIGLAQLYSTASYQAHDLRGINLRSNDLRSGNFVDQNLAGANFSHAELTGADFTNAQVGGASFECARGFTAGQLYSTTNYQDRDLTRIRLPGELSRWNFAGQDLTDAWLFGARLQNANFRGAILTNAGLGETVLTGADFTNAEIRGASFGRTVYGGNIPRGVGITPAQLYSTASYQARDLTGIDLTGNDLSGANFAGQNLTQVHFGVTNLTRADFTDSQIRGASFFVGCGRACGTGITSAQLYSTASYRAGDLTGIGLFYHNLSGLSFSGQNLTDAHFHGAILRRTDFREANLTNTSFMEAILTGADFTGAEIREANFGRELAPELRIDGTGITLAQLHSTASYQARDLSGIDLAHNSLSGGNFEGQTLTNANFRGTDLTGADLTGALASETSFVDAKLIGADLSHATLANTNLFFATFTGANLTAADARGASNPDFSGATTTNMILPDGRIDGLDLDAGGLLIVRDYDGDSRFEPALSPIPITVDQHLAMSSRGTLRMVFEADAWDSIISFASGIPVNLDGKLELTFAADVDLANQVGRTFRLFDWTGVDPTGALAVSSPYLWDLSGLYTTGEATLTGIPEPTALRLIVVAALAVVAWLRRRERAQFQYRNIYPKGSIHGISNHLDHFV
jgi:uncharacterized protein YjbI with pentapeptide repeats